MTELERRRKEKGTNGRRRRGTEVSECRGPMTPAAWLTTTGEGEGGEEERGWGCSLVAFAASPPLLSSHPASSSRNVRFFASYV